MARTNILSPRSSYQSSPGSSDMEESTLPGGQRPVATLYIMEIDESFQITKHVAQVRVYANDEFYVGRSDGGAVPGSTIKDLSVSNRHLKVRCAQFESDTSILPPLVYVNENSLNGTFFRRLDPSGHMIADEQRLDRAKGPLLLRDGDEVRLGRYTLCRLQIDPGFSPNDNTLTDLQKWEYQAFAHRYEITEQVIGTGTEGAVYAARHVRASRPLACKLVPISALPEPRESLELHEKWKQAPCEIQRAKMKDQLRGVAALMNLNHPNIIRLEKVFYSKNNIYIFTELLNGGDLYSYLQIQNMEVPEADAQVIVYQILQGVEYLHRHGVVHRDLKLENVLMTTFEANGRVVITDFGQARHVPKRRSQQGRAPILRMNTRVGTSGYKAPEIENTKQEGYTKAVDMWSVGIIASIILSGDAPSDSELHVAKFIRQSMLKEPYWKRASKQAKDFVFRLVVNEGEKRFSAREALRHCWLTNEMISDHLDSVYHDVIDVWRARPQIHGKLNIIEKLDLSKLGTPPKPTSPPSSPPVSPMLEKSATPHKELISVEICPYLHREDSIRHSSQEEKEPKCHESIIIDDSQSQLETLGDIVILPEVCESISKKLGQAPKWADAFPEDVLEFLPEDSSPAISDSIMVGDWETQHSPPTCRVKLVTLEDGKRLKRPVGPPAKSSLNASPASSFTDSIKLSSPPRPALGAFNPNQVGPKQLHESNTKRLKSRTPKFSKSPWPLENFRHLDQQRRKYVNLRNPPLYGDGFDGISLRHSKQLHVRSAKVSKRNTSAASFFNSRTARLKNDSDCLDLKSG